MKELTGKGLTGFARAEWLGLRSWRWNELWEYYMRGSRRRGGVMTCRFEGVVVEEVGVMRELAERIREW